MAQCNGLLRKRPFDNYDPPLLPTKLGLQGNGYDLFQVTAPLERYSESQQYVQSKKISKESDQVEPETTC